MQPLSHGIDPKKIAEYADEIKKVVETGIEVAIVIGGGNIEYKETTKNPGGLKEQFIDYFCSDNPILTIGEFEEFITSLGKININRFYKD